MRNVPSDICPMKTQLGHFQGLIGFFSVCMKKICILGYLNLCWVHMSAGTFSETEVQVVLTSSRKPMLWLLSGIVQVWSGSS